MFNEDTFNGKVALITGAGHPLANAVARRLSAMGARIALVHDAAHAEETARLDLPEGTLRYECDGADAAAVKTVVRAVQAGMGGIDILICGSSYAADVPLAQLSMEEWQRLVDARLSATLNFNREMIRPMMRTKSGRIVNVLYGNSGPAATVASRGVWAMSRALAVELAPQGIYVNCLSVGQMEETCAVDGIERAIITPDLTPLGRPGRADEAAQAAIFLASNYAAVTNGLMLHASGGSTHE
jgi:3-oxoacyl-[acyl-carrier protein] reductase